MVFLRRVIFAIFSLCAVSAAHGESAVDDVLVEVPLTEQALLERQVSMYVDVTGQKKFGDVLSQWQLGHFASATGPAAKKADTGAYWYRFVLANASTRSQTVVLAAGDARTRRVSLYVPDYQGRLLHRQAGHAQVWTPGHERARIPAFTFDLAPSARLPVYLRSDELLLINRDLTIWAPDHFAQYEARTAVMHGALLGSMLTLAIGLLMAYWSRRDLVILIFAGYVAAATFNLALMNGLGALFLAERLMPLTDTMMALAWGLTLGAGINFYRRYLRLGEQNQFVDGVVQVLQWCSFAIVLTPMLPTTLQWTLVVLAVVIAPGFTIAYLYIVGLRGAGPSSFEISWSLLNAFVLLYSLHVVGLLSLPGWAANMVLWCYFFSVLATNRALFTRAEHSVTAEARTLAGSNMTERRFYDLAQAEYRRASKLGRQLSLIVAQIDHYSYITGLYGADLGRHLRESFSAMLAESFRTSDVVADLGRGRFALLLVETDAAHALRLAQRLSETQEQWFDDIDQPITISYGVATAASTDESVAEPLGRARSALEKARERGLGQVVTQDEIDAA